MKIERFDGEEARTVLIGMATDPTVLARLAPHWTPNLFGNRWADLVSGWCVKYHAKYGTAPNADLEDSFRAWASRTRDADLVALIEKFLHCLSEQAGSSAPRNSEHLIDLARKHFDSVRLRKTAQEIQGFLDKGDVEAAERARNAAPRVELGSASWIDVLDCPEVVGAALERAKTPPLIEYGGDMGEFFDHRDCFHRDCLVGVMGQKGSRKSFWMIDMAWRAMLNHNRVAFFSVGDMSQLQVMNRMMARACGQPLKAGTVEVPVHLDVSGNVRHEPRHFPHPLTRDVAVHKMRELSTSHDAMDRLRLTCHPSRTISVTSIEAALLDWANSGWVCDVCVIDYADLLSSSDPKDSGRDVINTTWTLLRSLAHKLHALVITATQTDAASYGVDVLTRSNFTDDRRKIDHVNAMIGLNATAEERRKQITRLNLIALREGSYDEYRCVQAAGCLSLCDPCIVSSW